MINFQFLTKIHLIKYKFNNQLIVFLFAKYNEFLVEKIFEVKEIFSIHCRNL